MTDDERAAHARQLEVRAAHAASGVQAMFDAAIEATVRFVYAPSAETERAYREAAAGYRMLLMQRDEVLLERVTSIVTMGQIQVLDLTTQIERMDARIQELVALIERRIDALADERRAAGRDLASQIAALRKDLVERTDG